MKTLVVKYSYSNIVCRKILTILAFKAVQFLCFRGTYITFFRFYLLHFSPFLSVFRFSTLEPFSRPSLSWLLQCSLNLSRLQSFIMLWKVAFKITSTKYTAIVLFPKASKTVSKWGFDFKIYYYIIQLHRKIIFSSFYTIFIPGKFDTYYFGEF